MKMFGWVAFDSFDLFLISTKLRVLSCRISKKPSQVLLVGFELASMFTFTPLIISPKLPILASS